VSRSVHASGVQRGTRQRQDDATANLSASCRRRRLGKRRGPQQQPTVRKTNVNNFDRWQRQVVAGGNDVKQTALIMHRDRYTAGEAVSSQYVGELSGNRVVRSIQMMLTLPTTRIGSFNVETRSCTSDSSVKKADVTGPVLYTTAAMQDDDADVTRTHNSLHDLHWMPTSSLLRRMPGTATNVSLHCNFHRHEGSVFIDY